MSLASLGGGRLRGNRLVRLTYLDDCGLFNPHQEPFIVVGGVILDADKQLVAVEEELQDLIDIYIPDDDKEDFVFHATELWSGTRYFKDRNKWSPQKRLEILHDLAGIPGEFDFFVTCGFQDRQNIKNYKFPVAWDERQIELAVFTDVVARFCETVEHFMREIANDEVTMLIAEDRDSVKGLLKHAQGIWRHPSKMARINPKIIYFPFERIRDTIHFAQKRESAVLQLADVCAFIIKRRLMKDPHINELWGKIAPQMIVHPKEDES